MKLNAIRETKLIFNDFVRDIEKTLCLIKSDAVRHGQTLSIIHQLEREGFDIATKRMRTLDFCSSPTFFYTFCG